MVWEWLLKRDLKGSFHNLHQELRLKSEFFKKYVGMLIPIFDFNLNKICPLIQKKDTHLHLFQNRSKWIVHIYEHLGSARIKDDNEILYSFVYACLKLILYENILFQIMLNKCNIKFLKVLSMEKPQFFWDIFQVLTSFIIC